MHMIEIKPCSWPWEVQGPIFKCVPPLSTIGVRAPSVDRRQLQQMGVLEGRSIPEISKDKSRREKRDTARNIRKGEHPKSGHRHANARTTGVLCPARVGSSARIC